MDMRLNDNEVRQMARLAIMASVPVGMGHMHYNPDLKIEEINDLPMDKTGLYIDYYQGRMVKFSASKLPNGMWRFKDDISAEYESWIAKYPSYEKLATEAIK